MLADALHIARTITSGHGSALWTHPSLLRYLKNEYLALERRHLCHGSAFLCPADCGPLSRHAVSARCSFIAWRILLFWCIPLPEPHFVTGIFRLQYEFS